MVLEPDTGRCASFLVVPRRGVDTRQCASKDAGSRRGVDLGVVPHRLEEGKSASEDAGPRRGWIVMSHIGRGEEQNTIYKGVKTPFNKLVRFSSEFVSIEKMQINANQSLYYGPQG